MRKIEGLFLIFIFTVLVICMGVAGVEISSLHEENAGLRDKIAEQEQELIKLGSENWDLRDSAQRSYDELQLEKEKNEALVKQVDKLKKDFKLSMSDNVYFAKDSFSAKATAYTMRDEEGTADGITFTETRVQEGRTIAVDPKKIPLGSLVYIESKSPLVGGLYVAEDIGGAIDGNKIDIYMDSISNAFKFGRQDIKVTVLEERGL